MASTYELIVKAVDQTSGPLSKIERNLKSVNKQTGNFNKGMKSAGNGTGGLTSKVGGMSTRLLAAGAAFTAVAAGATIMGRAMINAAKQMETVQNQLRLVTDGQGDLAETQSRLTKLSRQNRSTLGPTVDLYVKLKVATEELGFTNERVEGLTTKMSQALAVSGADANTSAGAIRQFGQAMASGTVRGDEFNSIVEAMGPALSIMARESGITVGQLREMSQAGELTAERFSEILENSTALGEAFDKMQTPLATLESQLSEAFTTYLADLSTASGATAAYRLILEGMVGLLDKQNQATLEAATPLGALKIKLIEAQEAAAAMKTEALGLSNAANTSRDAFGLWREGTDRVSDSIVQLETPLDKMTTAIEEQDAAVVSIQNQIGEMIKADLAASIAKQQAAAAAELAAQAEKRRQAAIEASLSVLKAQASLVSSLAGSFAETLSPTEAFNYKIAQNQKNMDLLNSTLATNNQLTATQREEYEKAIQVLETRNQKLAEERDKLNEVVSAATPYQQYLANLRKTSAESALAIEHQVRALADVEREFLAGRMSIDAYAQAMLTLRGTTDETGQALAGVKTHVSGLDQFMNNLVESSNRAANEINYKAQAVGILDQMLRDGKINIDAYAQAILSIKDAAKKTADELAKTVPHVDQFTQFMNNLTDRAGSAATRIGHEAMAIAELKKQLDAGKISIDTYAQAMAMIGAGTKPGGDKPKTTKPKELTTSEQLVKTYADQNKKLTELQGALKNVAALSKEAGVTQEFLTEKIQAQMEALDVYKEKALTVSEIMKEGFQTAVQSLSSELANALVKGESVFDALKNSFNNMLQNILTQILQSQISSALAGLFGGAGGGGGGGLGGMLTGIFGTPTVGAPLGGFSLPFLANGGIAQAGKPHIVGEKGPELFMPASTGRVVANDELNTGGDGAVVNFNINAIDTQSGTQFLLENKQKIIGMVSQGFNQRGRQGITS